MEAPDALRAVNGNLAGRSDNQSRRGASIAADEAARVLQAESPQVIGLQNASSEAFVKEVAVRLGNWRAVAVPTQAAADGSLVALLFDPRIQLHEQRLLSFAEAGDGLAVTFSDSEHRVFRAVCVSLVNDARLRDRQFDRLSSEAERSDDEPIILFVGTGAPGDHVEGESRQGDDAANASEAQFFKRFLPAAEIPETKRGNSTDFSNAILVAGRRVPGTRLVPAKETKGVAGETRFRPTGIQFVFH